MLDVCVVFMGTWVDCQRGLSALKTAADVSRHTAILPGVLCSHVVDLKDAVGQHCYSVN